MFVFLDHLRLNRGGFAGTVVKGDARSGRQTLAGAKHRPPRAFAGGFGEEYFHGGLATYFVSTQAGGDDAGIIQNQYVAGAKVVWQIGEMLMGTFARGAVGDQ